MNSLEKRAVFIWIVVLWCAVMINAIQAVNLNGRIGDLEVRRAILENHVAALREQLNAHHPEPYRVRK